MLKNDFFIKDEKWKGDLFERWFGVWKGGAK